MKARYPKIDYSQVRPDWSPHREFAHSVNASSTIPAFVEPWLIKVFKKAKALLPTENFELHRRVDIFIAQEAQHYRQHAAFNRRIREDYPEIVPFEKQIEADYADMLENRSLKFCMAYSEGFESMGPVAAVMWFEKYDRYLEGADDAAVLLWKWHMAEEYEHREVCFQLFRALYARTLWGRFWNGWLYRCYGFYSALKHLGAYSSKVSNALIAVDQMRMAPADAARSKEAHGEFKAFMKKQTLPQLAKVLSPFYDPANKPEPKGWREFLSRFEKGGDVAHAGSQL